MTEKIPPAGYLGTDAQITSGPAPELVIAGYELEVADAVLLHRGLGLADLAHLVELVTIEAVPKKEAAALASALLEILDTDPAQFPYDSQWGDAYNSREHELERRLGGTAGWVHLGRTRREAGRIAFRLALRGLLLDLHEAVESFATALLELAAEHSGTLWADMTYLQPAQPSTFGHYLSSFGEEATRHLSRIASAYAWTDTSPTGSGGAGGSGVPLDRDRLAGLLGFADVGAHTRDVMWAVDGLGDVMHAAVQATLTGDRLAEDLEILASPGFGYLALDASLCRASVLMPQKRNPYALPVIRSGAGTLIGRLTGLLVTGRTPSARTDNWLHAYGEVASSVELATRLLRLAAAVVRTLQVNKVTLGAAASAHFVYATDLAEALVCRHGLDYRSAYRVIGRAVADADAVGAGTLTPDGISAAATTVLGTAFEIDGATLAAIQDPGTVVRGRTARGGSAPERVLEWARFRRELLSRARAWRAERRAASTTAEERLLALARQLARAESLTSLRQAR